MTEPGTGSDLQNIATKAIREGDEYVISGATGQGFVQLMEQLPKERGNGATALPSRA